MTNQVLSIQGGGEDVHDKWDVGVLFLGHDDDGRNQAAPKPLRGSNIHW